MKRIIYISLIIFNIALISYIVYEKIKLLKPQPEVKNYGVYQVFSYKMPDELSFAGENVPLENQEVKERLESELVKNTYHHSTTLLNMKRSGRWFPQMIPILKKYGIPEDFKYLPVIESNLQNLISRAGATGFWQLLKETAQEFGLEVNEEVDERYHPLKSTEAACKYLNKAYKKLGNWTNAAASYNRGMAGMQRDLTSQQVDSYYDAYLNRETAHYVIKAITVKTVFENPKDFGYSDIIEKYEPIKFKEIEVTQSIPDLVTFAISQGINYKTLKTYNPWLRGKRLTVGRRGKQKSYIILIPE